MSDKQSIIPISQEEQKPSKHKLTNFKIYLQQFLYLFAPNLFIFYTFLVIIMIKSIMGLHLLLLLIIGMIIECRTRWRGLWMLMSAGAATVISVQLSFLADSAKKLFSPDVLQWLGIKDNAAGVAVLIVWMVSIIIFGILVAITQTWSCFVIDGAALEQWERRFHPIFLRKATAERDNVFDSLSAPEDESHLSGGHEEPEEKLKKEFEEIKPIYYGNIVIRSFFEVYHRHGFEITLFCLVILAFYNLSIVSLFYVVIASAFSYFSHYFNSVEPIWIRRLNRLKWAWRILYILIAIDLLRKYFMYFGFPTSWGLETPAFLRNTFGCDPKSERVFSSLFNYSDLSDFDKCVNNFKVWYAIGEFSLREHVISFICFYMLVSYDVFFMPLKEESDLNYKEGDCKDFTRSWLRNTYDAVRLLIFANFHVVALTTLALVGLSSNLQGATDIIGLLYLSSGIFLLLSNHFVLKKKNSLWAVIEIANCLIMVATVIYQSPYFDCPVLIQDRYYFSNEECVRLQQKDLGETSYSDSEYTQFGDPGFFNKLSLLIGFNKIPNYTLFGNFRVGNIIFFYLFAFIQRKIWNHVYTKAYIEPYLQRELVHQKHRGIRYVEREHIKRIAAFKNSQLKKEFLNETEEHVTAKIKSWEEVLVKDRYNIQVEEKEDDHDHLHDENDPDHDKKMACLEALKPLIISKEIINFHDLLAILNKNDYHVKKCFEEICAESKKTRSHIREHLREIEEIGLPPISESAPVGSQTSNSFYNPDLEPKKELQDPLKVIVEERKYEDYQMVQRSQSHDDINSEISEEQGESESFGTYVRKLMLNKIHNSFALDADSDVSDSHISLGSLILYFLMAFWTEITYAVMILNFIQRPNLISFFLAFGIFTYAAVQYPLPSKKYWKLTIGYVTVAILVKHVFQFEFFCASPPFSFRSYLADNSACPTDISSWSHAFSSINYNIGIYKFRGDPDKATLSKDHEKVSVFEGLVLDFITLLVLIIQCWILEKRGIWDYITLSRSKLYTPQYNRPENAPRRPQKNIFKRIIKSFKSFIRNMSPYNSGLEHFDEFNFVKKPGKDFHLQTTVLGTLIMAFLLVFFTKITGEGTSLAQSLNESSFSTGMVLSVTIAILVLLFDRVLYKSREDLTSYHKIEKMKISTYLKHSFGLKALLHYTLTIVLMVFILSEFIRSENPEESFYLTAFSILCSFYLYFSGVQIKWGYPLYYNYHSFRSTDAISGTIYKCMKATPFLFELGSILDWTYTKTSLDLYQWMKLEDAWSYLYLKSIENKDNKQHKFGSPRSKLEKCSMGCVLISFIMLVLVGPLALFSGLNPNEDINPISSGTITINLMTSGENGTNSLFEIFRVDNLNIAPAKPEEFESFKGIFPAIQDNQQVQLQRITLNAYSDTVWGISPPNFKKLARDLRTLNQRVYVSIDWKFRRSLFGQEDETKGSNTIPVSGKLQSSLLKVLDKDKGGEGSFSIPNLIPKFLYLSKAQMTSLYQPNVLETQEIPMFTSCYLEYRKDEGLGYWMTKSLNSSEDFHDSEMFNSQEEVIFYAFSQRIKGQIFGTNLGKLGVITIYATIVLAIGRTIKFLFDRLSQKVIYDEIPETKDLIELIEAIYNARIEGNTYKEQKLYELLIRIYRSPEVLMLLTGRIQKYGPPEKQRERPIGIDMHKHE